MKGKAPDLFLLRKKLTEQQGVLKRKELVVQLSYFEVLKNFS